MNYECGPARRDDYARAIAPARALPAEAVSLGRTLSDPRRQNLRSDPAGDRSDVANRSAPDANIGHFLICRAESQRDSIIQPKVARNELPWVTNPPRDKL